jgi:UDP-2,3-diacylglucosamine pyrophosphatase LpxH
MGIDPKVAHRKLKALLHDSDVVELDAREHKLAILSDLHLGNRGGADNFRRNEQITLAALEYYRGEGLDLILLGDVEEFWQFDPPEVFGAYMNSIYKRIQSFTPSRIHRVFGNHDSEWGFPVDPLADPDLPGCRAHEALRLKVKRGRPKLLITHGHQGDKQSDLRKWFSRFFVRLFRFIESILAALGFKTGMGPEVTFPPKARHYEQTLYSIARGLGMILVCGHTHRAIFASVSYAEELQKRIKALEKELDQISPGDPGYEEKKKELEQTRKAYEEERRRRRVIDPTEPSGDPLPCYFNSGCALYSTGPTSIEIAEDRIRLVKWHNDGRKEPREVLKEGVLSKFVDEMAGFLK